MFFAVTIINRVFLASINNQGQNSNCPCKLPCSKLLLTWRVAHTVESALNYIIKIVFLTKYGLLSYTYNPCFQRNVFKKMFKNLLIFHFVFLSMTENKTFTFKISVDKYKWNFYCISPNHFAKQCILFFFCSITMFWLICTEIGSLNRLVSVVLGKWTKFDYMIGYVILYWIMRSSELLIGDIVNW